MAKRRWTPGDRLLGRQTTGDGYTFGQKPKMSETNLGKPGFLARLLTRASQSHKPGGKHNL